MSLVAVTCMPCQLDFDHAHFETRSECENWFQERYRKTGRNWSILEPVRIVHETQFVKWNACQDCNKGTRLNNQKSLLSSHPFP